MALKVGGITAIDANVTGFFSNTTFTGGSYLVMTEDPAVEYTFQGTISGYTSGGNNPGGSGTLVDTIDKFSLVSDGNASAVATLSAARGTTRGLSSKANGYTAGGNNPPTPTQSNQIEKFPFAVDANATDIVNMTESKRSMATASSEINGYLAGGFTGPPGASNSNKIERFPFAADANSIDIGDLTQARNGAGGHSSFTHGYVSGGYINPPLTVGTTPIQRYPFASDTNAGLTGDLATATYGAAGHSSETHGYTVAGAGQPPTPTVRRDDIQKFSFASDGDATDVGSVTARILPDNGVSSITNGYTSGGYDPSIPITYNIIERYPFSVESNLVDVGDLSAQRGEMGGHQR